MSETAMKFDQWAVLELFGHKRLAGRVQETTIAGGTFLRVDIPRRVATDVTITADGEAFDTRFYNPSAIYSISPVTEVMARAVAENINEPPIQAWELPRRQLAAGGAATDGDFDDVGEMGD